MGRNSLDNSKRYILGMPRFESSRPHLFAAGIDAFYPEPLPSGHPLLTNPRVTFSPHIAGTTIEASLQLARSAADQILTALHGELPAFPVNEAAWEGSRARRPMG
jgi:phosphoglycerate dehydrogenase-like enzyme